MKITLRALEITDQPFLVKWRNDVEVTSFLGGNRYFVSSLREESWIKEATLDRNSVRLIIENSDECKPIGMVNLTSISWINRSAEFSIFIGEKELQGKGAGKTASNLMLDYAYDDLNLNRVFLYVLESNKKAIRLYNDIGFIKEGVLSQAVYKSGGYIDMILMAKIKSTI